MEVFEWTPIIAQLFGALGFILGAIAYWQLDDKKMLILQAALNAAFLVQYALLGAISTSVLVVVLVVSSYVAAYSKSTAWMLFFMIASCVQWLFVGTPLELITLAATLIGLYAYYKMEGIPLRIAVFITGVLWGIISIAFGGWFSLAFNILTITLMLIAATRLHLGRSVEGVV